MSYDELKQAYAALTDGYNAQVAHARKHWLRAEAAEAERDALRAQVEAVRVLADEWECDLYASPRSCITAGPEVLAADGCLSCRIHAALSSSEPVTAGPEACHPEHKIHPLTNARMGSVVPSGHEGQTWEYCAPAGDVTPPAEQRAARHHHSRKATECVHTYGDCCVECCEPGGAFETFARPTTEGGRP